MLREQPGSQSQGSLPKVDRYPHFNRSNNMNQVLIGSPEINSNYFIDSLERFKKDHAVHHKQELANKREKRNIILQQKQQYMQNFSNFMRTANIEQQMRQQAKYSSRLEELQQGTRKNGQTTGIPVNPVTNEYETTYRGMNFQHQESEKQLNNLLRMHHLQKKGTCGYNPINGKQNISVTSLVPEERVDGMYSRISRYDSHYRFKPPQY